jgi:hypothetical protein
MPDESRTDGEPVRKDNQSKTNDFDCVALIATLACIDRQDRSPLRLSALGMESSRRSAR